MKTNIIKNIFLVWSWIAIATSTAIFATSQQWTSIQANLVNLVQYLWELSITSDGTPNGDRVLHIDGNGEFSQIRGNASLLNSSDNYFGMDGFVGSRQENTGGYAYINGIIGTEDPANFLGVVFGGNLKDYIWVQSWGITMTATPSWSDTWYDLDLTSDGIFARWIDQSTSNNMTRQDGTKWSYIMRLLNDGTLKLKNYIFPLADGTSGQVMTTDGAGQLSWADAGSSSASDTTTTVYLSSSDIQSLDTTPLTLIPAPQSNQVSIITEMIMIYSFGGTPYYMGNSMMDIRYFTIWYGIWDNIYQTSATDSILTQGQDAAYYVTPISSSRDITNFWGQPLLMQISWNGAENGDGTLELRITYKTIDL